MSVSINWLKEFVDIDWTPEELESRLTMAGIAIEGVEKMEDDDLLVLDLTPNRGDCQGMINLAREVAALEHKTIRIPHPIVKESEESIDENIEIKISDEHLCKRYAARVIKNVKIKESPQWLKTHLLHSGIRPINNVVDITNFVMLESNQPLHAFDYDLLSKEHRIIVRSARAGEKLTTLDDVERTLEEGMLLITDNDRPVGLAGIMGGQNSEITDTTVNVMLESACFAGGNIRHSSRKLALRSDASVRFEKGTDVNGVIYALDRAAALMQELADGEVMAGIADVYPDPQVPRQIVLRPERVNRLLGTEIDDDTIKAIFQSLAFKVIDEEDHFVVIVPSYRPDIEFEADLIEEIARLWGYDKIPTTLPKGGETQGGLSPYQRFREQIREYMAQNLYEIINFSFVTPRYFDMLQIPADSKLRNVIQVANPLSEEQSIMRTHLLGGLLDTVSRNLARKNNSLAFFEMGSIFLLTGEQLPDEVLKLGAVVAGKTEVNWLQTSVDMDFYFLKGILEQLLSQIGIENPSYNELDDPSYHPGRSARILCQGKELGVIGEIHPQVRKNYGIKPRACAFELDVETLYSLSSQKKMMEQITKYPEVERDLAILVNDEIQAVQAVDIIQARGGELLRKVVVFDLYAGEQVAEGYKSLAFRLTFQSADHTLTEEEVNACIENILAKLKNDLQATLR